jgi:hypothetical protein
MRSCVSSKAFVGPVKDAMADQLLHAFGRLRLSEVGRARQQREVERAP